MEKRYLSTKKALIFSLVLFIPGLVICIILNSWWPALSLLVGVPFSFYQFLIGREYSAGLSILSFGGVFVSVYYEDIPWNLILPVVFSLAAIYLFFGEIFRRPIPVVEQEDDLNHEIEEHTDHKSK